MLVTGWPGSVFLKYVLGVELLEQFQSSIRTVPLGKGELSFFCVSGQLEQRGMVPIFNIWFLQESSGGSGSAFTVSVPVPVLFLGHPVVSLLSQ